MEGMKDEKSEVKVKPEVKVKELLQKESGKIVMLKYDICAC